jgi:hypothetical protein
MAYTGYRPVGIDDEGNLPPRARQALAESAEVSAVIGGLAGSANNPHTSAGAARNAAVVKNHWQCPTEPANWLPGDEWVDNS